MNQLSSITPLEIILIALAAVGIFFFFRACWRNIKRSRQHLGVALLTLMMTLTAQTATAAVGDVVDSGTCGTNLAWTLTDNGGTVTLSDGDYSTLTLTITGTGAMYDYTSDTRPWGTADKIWYRITTLNLPEGITHIGDHAFYFTNYSGPLVIPSTVKTIGASGFYAFYGATSVTIPASVTSIGEYGLLGFGKDASSCTVTFAEGSQLRSIGANAFTAVGSKLNMRKCTKLTAITAEEVFRAYTKTVTFPKTLTSVCKNAFKKGSKLPTIKMDCDGLLTVNGYETKEFVGKESYDITSCFHVLTAGSSAVTMKHISFSDMGVLTLDDNITASGSTVEYDSKTYYYGTVTLGYTGTVPTGGIVKYAVNGEYISGNEFTISGEANVTAVVVYPYADISGLTYHGSTFDILGNTYVTSGSYYEINDEQDLIDLANYVNAGNGCAGLTIKMTRDLDFTNMPKDLKNGKGNFLPIGFGGNNFYGHFDGQNHSITGLYFNGDFHHVGLFGVIINSGIAVENVTLVNPNITAGLLVGGIVASMNPGTISNCAIVGGSITAKNQVGGIVGEAKNTTVSGCSVIGTSITATDIGRPVGIIAGLNNGGLTISNCSYYNITNGLSICGSSNPYTDGGGNQQVYQVTLGEGITAASPAFAYGNKAYYAENATVTLGSAREGYALLGYQSDDVTISNGTFTMPASDVSINANWADPNDISVNAAGDEYTIKTAAGWGVFCGLLEGGTSFTGKTVYLDKDISVTRMAGSSSHKFTGTFDGQGNVLTVSCGTEGTPINEQYAAPFSYVDGATIQNLSINGDIYTSAKYAAGIVSSQYGTVSISNCRVSINIHSSISGDGTHAGFVALNNNDATLNIEGCVFSGKLLTTNGTYRCAGYVGWRSGTVNISNSLYAPVTPDDGETWAGTSESATFVRNGGTSITNSYYTADFNDGSKFTAQGKQARSITAGENVTVANAGNATEYTVSGITSYGAGIKYGSYLYAGSGDEVSLTLSHGDREGYTFDGYTASAGTLSGDANPYTLTMPDENVTIGATFTKTPVTTSYVDADGTLHENVTAMPLDNSMTTLTAGWYVVNEDVNYTSMITLDGDVNLILGDGKTMTVTNTGTDVKDRAIYGDEKTLHIYGQSQGTGALTATAVGGESAIFLETSHDNAGSLLGIHGGVVSASTEWTGGVGISVQCATDAGGIVIDGGQVTASGNDFGIYCQGGHFDIMGGQVTATGGGLGICDCSLNPGVLTLGYSKATDFVSTNSIYNYSGESFAGEVKIADDQTLVDGNGNIWSGMLSNDEIQSIHNQTLRPVTGVALTKDGNNVSATFHGSSETTVSIPVDVNVTSVTYNRAFTEGKPSTVMLPFSLGEGQTLTGGKLYKFSGVTKNETTGKWEATMTETTTLQANTPYLLLPDENLTDGKVTFNLNNSTVTLKTNGGGNRVTADPGSHWTFKGTYKYMKWTTDTSDPDYNSEREAEIGRVYGFAGVAKTGIDLGDFVKAKSGARIRPMTCYLMWNDTPNNTRGMTRGTIDELPSSIVVRLLSNVGPGNQDDDDNQGGTTAIGTLDTETGEIDFGGWYDMSGHKLSAKPTKKGLYIHNGKKVIIK